MSLWPEEGAVQDHWPVRYPLQASLRQPAGRFRQRVSPRWAGSVRPDSEQVRKRLLWLLLAVEVGMALVAIFLVPLALLDVPLSEGGVIAALSSDSGQSLGAWIQAGFLVGVLVVPILLLTVGFTVGLVGWMHQLDKARSRKVSE